MSTAAALADRLGRAALCRAVEPGNAKVLARIATGGAAATWAALRDRFPDVDPAADLERLARIGGRLVCPGDPEWPARLDDLGPGSGRGPEGAGTPYALWVRGPLDLAEACARSVAVVGARAATPYGLSTASRVGADLSDQGWTVFSGAAYGIDAAAHHGALSGRGSTVAVVAGGIDVDYPSGNAELLRRIGREGLVVGEVPPGERPLRRRFLIRNRLIAVLSGGTVIVEAGARSGAINTAGHARRLGRPLMAVPGPVTSPLSRGCHQLLREHREEAVLVGCAAEVVEEIGQIGELAERARGPAGPRDHLSTVMLQVLDAVPPRRPGGLAAIAVRARQPLPVVLAVLGPLVTEGLVEHLADGYRLTALGRAPSDTPPAATG